MNELNVSDPVYLDVYVGAHCWQCPEARALAKEIAHEFPALVVRIVDVDQVGVQPPAAVFAVPTFVLNGKTISLGTPFHEELAQKITTALNRKGQESSKPRQNWLPAPE